MNVNTESPPFSNYVSDDVGLRDITSRLPTVFWWVSGMAKGLIKAANPTYMAGYLKLRHIKQQAWFMWLTTARVCWHIFC
jgi:hypothetical protein